MRSSNHFAIITILIAACCNIFAVDAAVYRCLQDDGHVSYQQVRCHQNSKPLSIRQSRTGSSGLRSGERALLGEYQKRKPGGAPKPQGENSTADKKTESCRTRKTQLDKVKEKLRRGYNIKEGDRLHQQRSDHEDYLRQFCSR